MVPLAPLWPQKEWFLDLLALRVEEPLEFPMLWNLLVGFTGIGSTQVEAIKQLVRKAGFFKVSKVITTDNKKIHSMSLSGKVI